MKSLRQTMLIIWAMCILYAHPSYAAYIIDYSGTLGEKAIGLAITTNDGFDYRMGNSQIVDVQYYSVVELIDVPLHLKQQENRNIIFEEKSASGEVVGTFNLNFSKQDPQHHFNSRDDLNGEVLTGTWNSADGKNQLPVYLRMEDIVTGEVGGRCDLNREDYQQLQKKIQEFHTAVVQGDKKTLKADFNFTLPKSADWQKSVAKAVPHNVFCNWRGYMIGNGIVWFDSSGNIISDSHLRADKKRKQ